MLPSPPLKSRCCLFEAHSSSLIEVGRTKLVLLCNDSWGSMLTWCRAGCFLGAHAALIAILTTKMLNKHRGIIYKNERLVALDAIML